MVAELWMSFNCRKRPAVNHASQVTLRDLEPDGTEIVSGLAIRAIHNRAAA